MILKREGYIYHHYEIEKEKHLLIDGFVESHGGTRFSAVDVALYTGLSEETCRRILRSHPLVDKFKDRGEGRHYLSLAPPLESTPEGELAEIEEATRATDAALQEYFLTLNERKAQNKRRNLFRERY